MKYLAAACLGIFLLVQTARAQMDTDDELIKRNEVSASFGLLTTAQILDLFLAATIQLASGDNVRTDVKHYSGGLFLTYRRKTMDEKLGYGLTIGYDRMSGNFTNESGSKTGTFKATELTLAGEGQIAYMVRPGFRLYGLVGVGLSSFAYKFTTSGIIDHEKVRLGHFNFQVSPIGAAFGNNIGGFIELGLGYKGLVNMGVYTKF